MRTGSWCSIYSDRIRDKEKFSIGSAPEPRDVATPVRCRPADMQNGPGSPWIPARCIALPRTVSSPAAAEGAAR